MAKTKVLITVKTYPNLSVKYDELVCTAGFKEDGEWIRIYPVRFRKLDYAEQYKKYQWIEIDLDKNKSDIRPESFRPISNTIKILDKIDTKHDWQKRKEIVLKNVSVNLKELIEKAHNNILSLAVFKPKEIINFIVEETERNWDEEKLNTILNKRKQLSLFEPENKNELVKKLPYTFYYEFIDEQDKKRRLMIEDWEIGALYWKCLEKCEDDEKLAIEQVKQKYFDEFVKTKDLYLFLGTTLINHVRKARNPFVIIGVFYPPKPMPSLFDYDESAAIKENLK